MKTKFFLIIAAAGMCGAPVLRAQGGGSLTPPPGPVAPTMKSLDQIDPGTPLDPAQFPATGYVITQPGSYYLTGNVTAIVATESAIIINASDVTLDLRGFAIIAASGTAATPVDSAIYAGNQSNITVRNGSVVGAWYAAIYTTGANCSAQDLRVSRMTNYGVRFGNGAQVSHCTAEGTGLAGVITTAGISTGTYSLVKDCTVALCDGDGIVVGAYSALLDSVAYDNASDGLQASNGCVVSRCTAARNGVRGIAVSDGATVAECSSHDNTGIGISADEGCSISRSNAVSNGTIGIGVSNYGALTDCNSTTNAGRGFSGNAGCTLRNCSASENDNDGFLMSQGSVLISCTSHSNGQTATNTAADGFEITNNVRLSNCIARRNLGSGIRATSTANYIDASVVVFNDADGIILPAIQSLESVVICNRIDPTITSTATSNYIGPFNDAYTTKPFSNF